MAKTRFGKEGGGGFQAISMTKENISTTMEKVSMINETISMTIEKVSMVNEMFSMVMEMTPVSKRLEQGCLFF